MFLSNLLKLKGHPFFKTSIVLFPSISIIALEWDKSVTAKSVSLNLSTTFLIKSFFVETKSQFFGPFHIILVFSLNTTAKGSFFNFKPSISIPSNETEEFLYWTIWTINKFLISDILSKSFSFLPS